MAPLLKACLNGSRQPSGFTRVPCTPSELAQAAAGAVAAGAGAVHLHPRDRTGAESLAATDVGAAVAEVRNACPGTAIGVSTGIWITGGSVRRRQALVVQWTGLAKSQRPDFASVNVHEQGFADLVAVLRESGVGIEPGVWSTNDADALAPYRRPGAWLRILVEIIDEPVSTAISAAEAVSGHPDWPGGHHRGPGRPVGTG